MTANYYNKLHIVIDNGGNPSDAAFAVAISTDAFASETKYIQNDNTIGSVLGVEDYQTYSSWGSSSGFDVLGLIPATTYTVKVKATHGKYTDSGWSSTGAASTVNATLSFSANTDSQPSPPFSISFGNIMAGSVTTSTDRINITFSTNASNGGNVYIYNSNSGLYSVVTGDTIASATADLAVAASGYGSRSTYNGQSSGGPFTAQSPYNGAADNVGILDSLIRIIYSSSAPVTNGSGGMVLKAKPSTLTKSATDYTDTITLIAASQY